MRTLLFFIATFFTTFCVRAQQDPCTPASATAGSITSTSAVITWPAAQQSGVTYILQYQVAPSGPWIAIATTLTSQTITNLTPGTPYNFRVFGNCSKPGNFATGSFTTRALVTACTNAFEPNQTVNTAANVNVNTGFQAAIATATDIDIYRLTSPGCGTLTITLSGLPADYALAVLNPLGGLVASSNNPGVANEVITINMTLADGVYIRVNSPSGAASNACYRLETVFTPSAAASCNNAYEPNQTLDAAATIPVGSFVFATIGAPDDQDYYKFTITQQQTINITLDNLPGDFDLELYNAAGTLLSSSSTSITREEIITITLQPGTYYIRVFPAGPFWWCQSSCYRLLVKPDFGCVQLPDQQENGNFWNTVTIPANGSFNGSINPVGDVDFYKFIIPYEKALVDIYLFNLPADYSLSLFQSNGLIIDYSDNAGTTDETFSLTLPGGTYVVRVESAVGASSADCYTLEISTEPLGARVYGGEENELTGTKHTGIYPNPVGNRLTVQYNSHEPGATCTLFDMLGRPVISQRIVGGANHINTARLQPGIYQLRIFNAQGRLIQQQKIIRQ
jgi:hypothetical protein